jgi:hypothetical protein
MKKTTVVFGTILIVIGFLFVLREYQLRSTYGSPISGTGTLKHMQFEGGFWGIIADDGKTYDISSACNYFSEDFHIDGLRVGFMGYVTNAGSYHMWGRVLILVDIWRI